MERSRWRITWWTANVRDNELKTRVFVWKKQYNCGEWREALNHCSVAVSWMVSVSYSVSIKLFVLKMQLRRLSAMRFSAFAWFAASSFRLLRITFLAASNRFFRRAILFRSSSILFWRSWRSSKVTWSETVVVKWMLAQPGRIPLDGSILTSRRIFALWSLLIVSSVTWRRILALLILHTISSLHTAP